MPFPPKSMPPRIDPTAWRQPVVDRAVAGRYTLFTAPPGFLLSESLAAALAEYGRPTLWFRAGPEDRDPAAFLVALVTAARRLCPEVGTRTLEQMRRSPGPVTGWPAHFTQLGRELAEALPPSAALVVERAHFLDETHPTLALLAAHLLPALPDSTSCILTAEHDLPHAIMPYRTIHYDAADLRLDAPVADALARQFGSEFSSSWVSRLLTLVEGRPAALVGLLSATALLGPASIRQAVERASGPDDLLDRVARAWLAILDTDARQALALALHLEYSHPALVSTAPAGRAVPHGPWLQPLDDGWSHLRRIWHEPLRSALRAGATPTQETVRRAAGHLIAQGAIEQAVSLYLHVGDATNAARVIAERLDSFMNLGQWETLSGWLAQLPMPVLRAWPWLIYAGAEIASARGSTGAARHALDVAASLFNAQRDVEGECQSLLAESALAAWEGDRANARARALAAGTLAAAAGLVWHQGWASWQLGCLAAAAGDLEDAVTYLRRAAAEVEATGDAAVIEIVRMAEELVVRRRDLRREREFHRRAYYAAESAEREVAGRLSRLLDGRPERLNGLLQAYGWSSGPLLLELSAPAPPRESLEEADSPELWESLLPVLGLRKRSSLQTVLAPGPSPSDLPEHPGADPSTALAERPPTGLSKSAALERNGTPPAQGTANLPALPDRVAGPLQGESAGIVGHHAAIVRTSPRASEPAPQRPERSTLTAHLLGGFRVTLNERAVERWESGRGRLVFQYLLIHRHLPTPRDVLMDLFWPEATPESARNSLNVALHGLRRSLKAADDVPVVIYRDGAYTLNPDLDIWLDVAEFERHVKAGRRLETGGQLAAATVEYEAAANLYQGDFLADAPYEEWPVLTRERLRVAYLETLDSLSRIYFGQGQYAACATLCQLILSRDNCREDAHCRLMRCYARQNQRHLALRQYQACVHALREELDVEPAPATTQLYERIRRREQV